MLQVENESFDFVIRLFVDMLLIVDQDEINALDKRRRVCLNFGFNFLGDNVVFYWLFTTLVIRFLFYFICVSGKKQSNTDRMIFNETFSCIS